MIEEELIRDIETLKRKVATLEAMEGHNFSALNIGTATGAGTGNAYLSGQCRVTSIGNSGANAVAEDTWIGSGYRFTYGGATWELEVVLKAAAVVGDFSTGAVRITRVA